MTNPSFDVQPISKSHAPPEVRRILDDIEQTLGIPWSPSNWRAYAIYPQAMLRFWDRLKPAINTGPFLGESLSIAEHANRSVDDWYKPAGQFNITEHDQRRIRHELDAFEYGTSQLLIQQAALSRASRGEVVGLQDPIPEATRQPSPYRHPEIELVEDASASVEIRALFQDIQNTLQLPLVNSIYRAMAKWPGFLWPAWQEIKPHLHQPHYHALCRHLARMADEAAGQMNPAVRLDPLEIRAAVADDEQLLHLRQMIDFFTHLLPGVVANVAMLRLAASRSGFTPPIT